MKDFKQVKIISLATILAFTLAACGGSDGEDLPTEFEQPALVDADGDGVSDRIDAFPNDPNEYLDTDGDGVGNNSDVFPHDSGEWLDTDGDGYGDNIDAFPSDATEWADANNNGIGDNSDASGGNDPSNGNAGAPTGDDGDCDAETSGVNWDALMTENCSDIASYNLFSDNSNPTQNPNAGGIPFDLAVPLFTDYATKYRFAFIPQGMQAKYSAQEVLDFPVGTVLVKTFTMPVDTADREGDELVIETRLLIHRPDGWRALPYYWDPQDTEGSTAKLAITGASLDVTTMHKGEELAFTYQVPKATSCNSCHQILPVTQGSDDIRPNVFKPIGPKARNLNKDYEYPSGSKNQLTYWAEKGILSGLPEAAETIEKIMLFRDDTVLSQLSAEELDNTARGYLDINCAHCHRSELSLSDAGHEHYAGAAGYTGLQLEFNRDYEEQTSKFGSCKQPIANRDDSNRTELKEEFPSVLQFDVVPQAPEESYLLYRLSTVNPNQRMAPLGRSTSHKEGIELITAWIESLPAEGCSPE